MSYVPIVWFVAHTWHAVFSVPGMNKWLYRNGFTYNPDNLRAGQLHAAGQNRNGHGGTGKSGTPHAGGETPAGCGDDVRVGTDCDAGRAGAGAAARRNQRVQPVSLRPPRAAAGADTPRRQNRMAR